MQGGITPPSPYSYIYLTPKKKKDEGKMTKKEQSTFINGNTLRWITGGLITAIIFLGETEMNRIWTSIKTQNEITRRNEKDILIIGQSFSKIDNLNLKLQLLEKQIEELKATNINRDNQTNEKFDKIMEELMKLSIKLETVKANK